MSNCNTAVPRKSRSFDENDTLVFTSEWRVDGDLTTPTGYSLTVLRPDSTTAAATVSVASTGKLTANYTPSSPGRFWIQWKATGTAKGIKEESFYVTRDQTDYSNVYPEYG